MKEKKVNVSPSDEQPSLAFIFGKKLLEHKKAVEEYLENGGEFDDIPSRLKFVMPCTTKEFMEQIFPLFKWTAK